MVRQAKSYLVGAMSGAGVIAVAVVAFVLLVSALVFEDFPVAGLVGGGDDASVSSAEPAGAAPVAAGAATRADGADAGGPGADAGAAKGGGGGSGDQGVGSTGSLPTGGGEVTGGSGGSTTTATTGGGSGGGGGAAAASGGGGGTSGGGGAEGGGSTATTTTGKVTGTVNETVNQVDQTVTGGALEDTGVTEVTEDAVNGVAGPESTVGKVVDETAKTVEGVLGAK